jgi:hypothetical protein
MLVGDFQDAVTNTHRSRCFVLALVNRNQLPNFIDPGRLIVILGRHGLESGPQ